MVEDVVVVDPSAGSPGPGPCPSAATKLSGWNCSDSSSGEKGSTMVVVTITGLGLGIGGAGVITTVVVVRAVVGAEVVGGRDVVVVRITGWAGSARPGSGSVPASGPSSTIEVEGNGSGTRGVDVLVVDEGGTPVVDVVIAVPPDVVEVAASVVEVGGRVVGELEVVETPVGSGSPGMVVTPGTVVPVPGPVVSPAAEPDASAVEITMRATTAWCRAGSGRMRATLSALEPGEEDGRLF